MGTASPLLTDRQQAALAAVAGSIAARGYPPTHRELGATLGLSSLSSVHAHLAALERKGFVAREVGSPRAIRLTHAGTRLLAVHRLAIHRLTQALAEFDWSAS